MFKKKTKITFTFEGDGFDILHNFNEKTDKHVLEAFLKEMVNGNLGITLLNNLSKSPVFNELCMKVWIETRPVQNVEIGPIVKPSQVMSNFIANLKNLMNP